MDPKAYEKVKRHLAEMIRAYEVKPEPPPPQTNTREWAQARMRTKQREIDEIRRLTFEPKTWSRKEQDALAEIAASSLEPRRDRQSAMNLMVIWKMTHHANLLAALLEDPHTDPAIRYVAALTLGRFGRKEMLPLIYGVAMSVKVPPEAYIASLYGACVQAIFLIAAKHGFVDESKYNLSLYPAPNETCRRWWEETQPTEQTILAWSRGEKTG
jgi:hypothetical protein